MREEFEKLVVAGKISHRHIEPLLRLTEGTYCMHKSWGFGKLTGLDTVMARITIDFQGRPGHSMDLAFAAESLKPIGADHILARKASDLEGLRHMAALKHLELIQLVLQSYGGKCTVDQIQQALVPDVIADDWKKWWEAAKREMKKDGHFVVPTKKTEPILYQAQEVSLQERLLSEFRAAKGLKARIAVASEFLKSVPDVADAPTAAQEIIAALNADIASHQRTMPALALEGIFLRDEIRAAVPSVPVPEGELTVRAIWSQGPRLGPLLEQMPASRHKKALQSFQEATPDTWPAAVLGALNTASTKLCAELASLLIEQGKFDSLKDTLARLISQHNASSELLLWLAKERSDSFADILGPEVFRAMLTAIERDQFNEKKSNRLADYILSDQDLLVELIESADIEVIKDITRALQLSPCFDDMDKRSLLARIVKTFPYTQSLITGEHAKQDNSLIVSWESLERRKQEYTELVEKRIPANSKEIAIARSYGDLRENHEYKAAKEMHRLLMRRKAELEQMLARARGTDFANPRTDVVSVGTKVYALDLHTNNPEAYTILGAWDFEGDKHVISYLSPIAQAMLNHKAGEEVEFEMEGVKKRYRIDAIEAYQATPSVAPRLPPGAAPQPMVVPASPVPPTPGATAGPATVPEPPSESVAIEMPAAVSADPAGGSVSEAPIVSQPEPVSEGSATASA
jgi:transcription elongation GreA/GreB family factor